LGTLNRVMIVELSVPAMIVAAMIAIPVLVAPFRAFLGHRSDTYRSALGWKRVPYLWFGSLWQMGGLAVMPFALLVLSGDRTFDVPFAGEVLAAVAFLMTGLGMHMTQTAGLALASDRASDATRPRVVALLYVANLLGMGVSALAIGWLLLIPLQLYLGVRLINSQGGQELGGVVGGAVVDHDHLKTQAIGGEGQGRQTAAGEPILAMHRHHHAHLGVRGIGKGQGLALHGLAQGTLLLVIFQAQGRG
jgi:hypothetical protein